MGRELCESVGPRDHAARISTHGGAIERLSKIPGWSASDVLTKIRAARQRFRTVVIDLLSRGYGATRRDAGRPWRHRRGGIDGIIKRIALASTRVRRQAMGTSVGRPWSRHLRSLEGTAPERRHDPTRTSRRAAPYVTRIEKLNVLINAQVGEPPDGTNG